MNSKKPISFTYQERYNISRDEERNGIVRSGNVEVARTKAYRASKSVLERPSISEAEANARLIAAAPFMYKLLSEVYDKHGEYYQIGYLLERLRKE